MRTVVAIALLTVLTGLRGFAGPDRPASTAVTVSRLADGAIQPQAAADGAGGVHVIYFRGEPAHGDLFYMGSTDGGRSFADPIRVNSTFGASIATGTVRGGQIAVGRSGRVHVAWNGSRSDGPGSTPMFYTRLNQERTAFEPERNVMHAAYNIDGGGAVAADRKGHVYVASVIAAPGDDRTRKHPALAGAANGDVLLAWTEGTAWNKGGAAAWQVFGSDGQPIGESGRAGGVPVWGLVAAYARPGGFSLVY
jgi:hypothetical protein